MRNIIISVIISLFCTSALAQKTTDSTILRKENKFNFISEISKNFNSRQSYLKIYSDFVKRKLKNENPEADDKVLTALSYMIIQPAKKNSTENLKSKKNDLILQYYKALANLDNKKNKSTATLLAECLKKSPDFGYTRFFILQNIYRASNGHNGHKQAQILFEKLILSRGVKKIDAGVICRITLGLQEPAFIIRLVEKLKNAENIDEWYKLVIRGYAKLLQARQAGITDINQANCLKDAEKDLVASQNGDLSSKPA